MNKMHVIPLRGCTPEPLGNYLKGLGVFRVFAEQYEHSIKMWWQEGHAWLLSSGDESNLIAYMRDHYAPTPFLGVWGGRLPYFEDGNAKARGRLEKIEKASHKRFSPTQLAVKELQELFKKQDWTKTKDAKKDPVFVRRLRNTWTIPAVRWLDALLVLEQARGDRELAPAFGWLFGTGGNEGSGDIVNNVWEMMEEAIGFDGNIPSRSEEWLKKSLLSEACPGGVKTTAGQHFPWSTEAVNQGQRYMGQALTNPWDVILMMEGALMFSGSLTKRLSQYGGGKGAFPFMVDSISCQTIDDEKKSRAAIFAPVWSSLWSYQETEAFFLEGRLQRADGRGARHALGAMAAIAERGCDRGVHKFNRYDLLERRGKGYYIAVQARDVAVPDRPSRLPTLLDPLLDFRDRLAFQLNRDKNPPKRLVTARQRLDAAIESALTAELATPSRLQPTDLLAVLEAAAACVEGVARKQEYHRFVPVPGLVVVRGGELSVDDGSVQFRLARSLASMPGFAEYVWPIREWHSETRTQRAWCPNGQSAKVAWGAQDLVSNLIAVFERRLVEESRQTALGARGSNLFGFVPAQYSDLVVWWDELVDIRRLAQLVPALLLARWNRLESQRTPNLNSQEERVASEGLPRSYALLKLVFLGGPLPARPGSATKAEREDTVRSSLDVLRLLHSARAPAALVLAARRLGARGLPPLASEVILAREFIFTPQQCRHLAAMLLWPIGRPQALARLVIKPEAKT